MLPQRETRGRLTIQISIWNSIYPGDYNQPFLPQGTQRLVDIWSNRQSQASINKNGVRWHEVEKRSMAIQVKVIRISNGQCLYVSVRP